MKVLALIFVVAVVWCAQDLLEELVNMDEPEWWDLRMYRTYRRVRGGHWRLWLVTQPRGGSRLLWVRYRHRLEQYLRPRTAVGCPLREESWVER